MRAPPKARPAARAGHVPGRPRLLPRIVALLALAVALVAGLRARNRRAAAAGLPAPDGRDERQLAALERLARGRRRRCLRRRLAAPARRLPARGRAQRRLGLEPERARRAGPVLEPLERLLPG